MNEPVPLPPKTTDQTYYLFALKIVGDFGLAVAAPVIIFVLIGQKLDNFYHVTTPWFTLIGFFVAVLTSGIALYRKAKKYGSQYQKLNQK